MPLNIVLVHPEIPQNTGNISRTCAATGTVLHLVEPLGFSLEDRYLKRAGLDYWPMLTLKRYPDWEAFTAANPGARMHFATKKAPRGHTSAVYRDGDFLVFGCESKGLPEALLREHWAQCVRIPMRAEARSLNLSNSVAVVLYEALRQLDFPGLTSEGPAVEPEGSWQDDL